LGFVDYLQYGFIQRALISGVFIALLCSILGVLIVLRRLSLIGDGLAHVTFGSVALGLALRIYPLYVTLPIVLVSSIGILKMTERARMMGGCGNWRRFIDRHRRRRHSGQPGWRLQR